MSGISDYGAFVAAILLLLVIPGPCNLAMLSATAQGGLRGGLASTLGIMAGDQVLLWCAVAGLAALLKAHPATFAAVQWAGALYLAFLGLRLLLARPGHSPALKLRPRHFLRQSFLITLLNPKAIVFYMAFFPLFVKAGQAPEWLTFGAMALTIALLTLAYGTAVCLLTHHLAARVRAHPRVAGALQKLAGLALLGFGARAVIRTGSMSFWSRASVLL
ncbi:MAG: LysE family transporter [Burkholderiaceae bacterium]|jgi:threonine/homoserine/homoserine lactone efflux protein|nr:LysE family transporter [Burkholderiaceae bacterium]